MPSRLRKVTVYIGWPDNTWEFRELRISARIPVADIDCAATSEALRQIEKEGRHAAFVGVHHYESLHIEHADIGGEGAV